MQAKIDYKTKLQELQLRKEKLNQREAKLNLREEKLNKERIILKEGQTQLEREIESASYEKHLFLHLNEDIDIRKNILINLCQEIQPEDSLDDDEI